MKHIPLFTFAFCLHLSLLAAVPLRWTVETSRATPAQFEAYQGETLALEATLQSYGKPLEASGIAALYWQTNGMGSTYWETSAAVNSNRFSAVFTPEMDVGAKVYNCFIGVPGTIYHAAFQLRLRPSPGATPNVLPLPVPVIDFAKVRVLNPPWEGGGDVNTNAVIDIIHETVSGSARSLPRYLHALDFCDSYPDSAEEYYRSRGNGKTDGGCSAVRDGGFLCRNFDYPFDDRTEFVVRMSAGPNRFASVGVAQVGTNLTEQIVTSGKPSRCYKWLPGATVDGINENGVVCEINVVDTPVTGWHTTGDLHPLGAIRWILDHATNAQGAAEYIAANIRFPTGWMQNFHYMVADATSTYIVENGTATSGDEYHEPDEPVTMTNFQLSKFPWDGMGMERFGLLLGGANITNAWYTRAYLRSTNWISEFKDADEMEAAKSAWETYTREHLRGHGLWQSVHTSVYDITNRTLRVAVQETDDWYTFQVPVTAPKIDAYTKAETDAKLSEKIGGGDVPSFEQDPAVKLTNGVIDVRGTTLKPLTSFTEQDPMATEKAQAEILAQGLDKAVKTDDEGIIQEEVEFGNTVKISGMLQLIGYPGIGVGHSEYDADGIYVYDPQQGIGEMFYFPWYRPSGWESDKRHFFASVADVPEVVSPSSTSTVEQAASALSTYNQIAAKYTKPSGGIPETDLADGVIPDVSGFVPYTGANQDVDLGHFNIMSYGFAYFYAFNANGTDYQADSIYPSSGQYWLPWADDYGVDPTHDFALVSQIEAATNGLAATIPKKINAAVSANLNTYIDGETGVEYVGKFYGGSLYYVPTGNVYPPNN